MINSSHFQANETSGSSPMELEGARRGFAHLKSVDIRVAVLYQTVTGVLQNGLARIRQEHCTSLTSSI